ncbi:hypothetical protein D3C81_1195220 [compost metagenome]
MPPFDDDIARQVGVINEEIAIARVLRVEGQRQQPPLAAGGGERADIEEGRGQQVAVLHHADASCTLENEQAAVAGRRRQENGRIQARGHFLQGQGQRRAGRIADHGAGRRAGIDLHLLRRRRGRQAARALQHAGGADGIGAGRQARQGA